MITPAPQQWSALLIHLTEGAANLAQLLAQQGYSLAEEWDEPTGWRTEGQPVMEMAHLDLTRSNQSGTILFLRTIAQLRSPVVVLVEFNSRPVADGSAGGRVLVLRKAAEPAAAEPPLTRPGCFAPEPDQFDHQLVAELKVQTALHLASGFAHDANNYMTVVSTCASLLRHEELSATARSYVDDICAASNRAAALLQQLASLCRHQVVPPRVLDLNHVILDVGRLLARLLGEEVKIAFDLERSPCLVKVDPRHLEQVLLNLAVNARDAMTRRGLFSITTTLTTVQSAPGVPCAGRFVRLSVRDNGCGMTEKIKAHIFEPFFSTKAVGKGTGVGLATVDRIVRVAGGRIEVDSAPGQGTTFHLYFPEAVPADAPSEKEPRTV